ncbi:hypothetical protein [Alishewanella sp. SMS8]|uniref:hypothetical protein n=1 Tax=Alishewanella sp. SMS8 TaxID=2994676 RepID=UPI00274068FD|nr:hypothetical protein [Alishewanella sp. SMS8]MDP5459873.1 hypothetical protein [Alishewanella sp. SMS8]
MKPLIKVNAAANTNGPCPTANHKSRCRVIRSRYYSSKRKLRRTNAPTNSKAHGYALISYKLALQPQQENV